jgi:hypothetical protein
MTSGLLEQELKKEGLKDADKGTSYLAIKAAQDLAKEMLIFRYRFNHNGTATPDMPVAAGLSILK